MVKYFRFLCLAVVLSGGLYPQEEHKGSNYDPAPKAKARREDPPPAPPPSQEAPAFQLPAIDWNDKTTYVKIALLVGSILLARRAFKQMRSGH